MIAWIALALALLELVFLLAILGVVRRFWREAAPTVAPLLAMFVPPGQVGQKQTTSVGGTPSLQAPPPE